MSRELYIALSGASASWTELEVMSGNLANVSTTGFKEQDVAFEVIGPDTGALGKVYASTSAPTSDTRQGTLVEDGDPNHLGLQGPGWFVLQGSGSEAVLTRDGRFGRNGSNQLATSDGLAVLGAKGPIQIPPGQDFSVDRQGRVFVGEAQIDQLRVVDAEVKPVGNNRFSPIGALRGAAAEVRQGALEGSNVDALSGMAELIKISRHFEAMQKAMQASDELDSRLNRLGGH